MTKTRLMQKVEERQGAPIEDVLRAALESGESLDDVAKRLGVTRSTVHIWLWRLGAEVETRRVVRFAGDAHAAVV